MRIAKAVRARRRKGDNLVFIVYREVISSFVFYVLQSRLLWTSGI